MQDIFQHIKEAWADEEYYIASAIDGNLVLTAYGFAMENAAPIRLWQNEHHDDQIWILRKGVGFCYFINKHSLKYLNCTDGPVQGHIVSQYEEGDNNSKWNLIPHNNYVIIKHFKTNMCIDVPGAVAKGEVILQLWPKNGTNAQDFILRPVK